MNLPLPSRSRLADEDNRVRLFNGSAHISSARALDRSLRCFSSKRFRTPSLILLRDSLECRLPIQDAMKAARCSGSFHLCLRRRLAVSESSPSPPAVMLVSLAPQERAAAIKLRSNSDNRPTGQRRRTTRIGLYPSLMSLRIHLRQCVSFWAGLVADAMCSL